MKKSSLAVVIVAALAVGYPAASWVTGKRLEVKLTEDNKKASTQPGIKMISQSYERGIFTSVQKGTIEFKVAGMAQSPAQTLELSKVLGNDAFKLSYVNKIVHGPFPGYFGIAAGKVETDFVIDPKVMEEIKKVFGEKKFLELTTILNYAGGGTVKLSSPAVITKVGKTEDQLNWKGIKGEINFNEAYTQFKMNIVAPGLDMASTNGGSFKMGEIKLNGDAERLSPEHALYTGKTLMTVQSMNISTGAIGNNTQVDIADIKVESNSTSKNDLFNSSVKFGMGKLSINAVEFTKIHFDYAMNNLHGPTLESLIKEFDKLANQHTDGDQGLESKMIQYGKELIKHKPELVIEKWSIAGKTGDANMNGKLTLAPIADEELHSLAILFSKLIGQFEAKISEDFLIELMSASIKDPNALAQTKATLDMQIKAFEAQGYISRKEKTLISLIDWKNGKLTINKLPFPPEAPEAEEMAEEMPEEDTAVAH